MRLFLAVRTPFSCRYNGPPFSIFAARVHGHQWGLIISILNLFHMIISLLF